MATFNGLKWVPELVAGALGPGRLFSNEIGDIVTYELDPDTLLQIGSNPLVSGSWNGVGGSRTRLFMCATDSFDLVQELDPDTNNVINSVASPAGDPQGMGGISIPNDRIYSLDRVTDLIYEHDQDTLLPISNATVPNTNEPRGIGGSDERLYTANTNGSVYEIDPTTKLQISSASATTQVQGVGGITERCFICNPLLDSNFEIDLDTKLPINTVTSISTNPFGIGGIKFGGSFGTKVIIEKHTLNGKTFNLETPFLDTKPQ